ncbi:MAG: hypothetical protein EPO28_03730 [Saprospiraceae bacterium]|nr:MAG: hypothetical protein EPO28_03730 [Saprospiraceae bacterium]
MVVTKRIVAQQIFAYLNRKLPLEKLVDWSETVTMEGNIAEKDMDVLMTVLGKLGLADVRNFGLTWEDCQAMMNQLGYSLQVEMEAAA